jgi:hypothetical protein
MVITRKRGKKMVTKRYDVLPKKAMSKVSKDIKDIKKKLKGKTVVRNKNSLKLIPKKDVSDVKKDIRDIKNTLKAKLKTDAPKKAGRAKKAKVMRLGNYYDILPHRKVERLEEEVISLKGKLKNKQPKKKIVAKKARKSAVKKIVPKIQADKEMKNLERSVNKLSGSINRLMRLFEIAQKEPDVAPAAAESQPQAMSNAAPGLNDEVVKALVELKEKISELSMENEEMAKGILVVAEMLKEALPERKEMEPTGMPPEGVPIKSETFAAFGGSEKNEEVPLPPLDSMPDNQYPQPTGMERQQGSRRNIF